MKWHFRRIGHGSYALDRSHVLRIVVYTIAKRCTLAYMNHFTKQALHNVNTDKSKEFWPFNNPEPEVQISHAGINTH